MKKRKLKKEIREFLDGLFIMTLIFIIPMVLFFYVLFFGYPF